MLHSLSVVGGSGTIDTMRSQGEFCGDLASYESEPFPTRRYSNPPPKLPPVGKAVRVRHNGLERIAYLDAHGKWRKYDNGDLLGEEVTILSLDMEPSQHRANQAVERRDKSSPRRD